VKYIPTKIDVILLTNLNFPVRFLVNKIANSVTAIVSAQITGMAIKIIRFHG
jgi:hypothetical protein